MSSDALDAARRDALKGVAHLTACVDLKMLTVAQASDLQGAIYAALARLEAAAREDADSRACHHGWRGSVPEDGQRIITPCPACGAQSLFIGNGGHLTCASVPKDNFGGCPDPSVEDAIKHKIAAAREEGRRAGRIEQADLDLDLAHARGVVEASADDTSEGGLRRDGAELVARDVRRERDSLRAEAGTK